MTTRALVAALAAALLAPATVAAAAKPAPITASIPKGMTLVALGADGRSTSQRGPKVRLTPPAATVSVQLIDAHGVYAGPLVAGKKGSKLVMGVRAGAKLGSLKHARGAFFAKVATRFQDPSRLAVAKGGAPLGAGRFGLVRAAAVGAAGPGRDQDLDGIPGAFDVDDNGNLVLDNVDRTARTRQALQQPQPQPQPQGQGQPQGPGQGQPAPTPQSRSFTIFSNLKTEVGGTVNANASAVTQAQMDALVSQDATLAIGIPQGGDDVQLDCAGLSYCTTGGTGQAYEGTPPEAGRPFPAAFDADNNGWGSIAAGSTGDFQLHPGTAQIGSGDAFIEHVFSGGREVQQIPFALNYMFTTTPALISYQAGDVTGTITYPAGPNPAGSAGNPIPVPAGTPITMTFWRPQRRAIPGSGEPANGFIDMGHLSYEADVPNVPQSAGGPPATQPVRGPGPCSASSYATSDPNLSVTGAADHAEIADAAADRPADPANTLTFTVDLDTCLAATGATWGSGQQLRVDIQAKSLYGDNAAQGLWFVRE